MEKRFTVTITTDVKEVVPGSPPKAFTNTTTTWNDVPPEGLAMIERTGLEALAKLRDFGDGKLKLAK